MNPVIKQPRFGGERGGPLVSVLLPAYNAHPYLGPAVDSILRQTYENLELILVDDGSTDASVDLMNAYAAADPRIRLVRRRNMGVVASLNAGLALAKGKYLARMDADDISMPLRLARQVAYLEANQDVVILGVEQFESSHARRLHRKVVGKRNCTWALLFHNYIGHPGVMFRLETLRTHGLAYDSEYQYVEDYRLWCELTRHGFAQVLAEPLLFYRRHGGAASRLHAREQAMRDRKVSIRQIQDRLRIDLSDMQVVSPLRWALALNARIFGSRAFEELSAADRRAIHLMFQEYAPHKCMPASAYLRQVGLRPLLEGRWWGLSYIYRSLKYASGRRWLDQPLDDAG